MTADRALIFEQEVIDRDDKCSDAAAGSQRTKFSSSFATTNAWRFCCGNDRVNRNDAALCSLRIQLNSRTAFAPAHERQFAPYR